MKQNKKNFIGRARTNLANAIGQPLIFQGSACYFRWVSCESIAPTGQSENRALLLPPIPHPVTGKGGEDRLERKRPPHPTLHNWGAMTAAFECFPFLMGQLFYIAYDALLHRKSEQISIVT